MKNHGYFRLVGILFYCFIFFIFYDYKKIKYSRGSKAVTEKYLWWEIEVILLTYFFRKLDKQKLFH